MVKLNEQFDVLSNTLRVLPEEMLRLRYFVEEIGEPEEGISNIEVACVNVFNNIYGLMCILKEKGATQSIYEHDAITTILCIRHVLQHQSGRLKNCLRDAWSRSLIGPPVLIKYDFSKSYMPDLPLYIGVDWFQRGIASSDKISKKIEKIDAFWNFQRIQLEVQRLPSGDWASTYVCAMTLITEAVRVIVSEYGQLISATGYDSRVYLEHFKEVRAVDTNDYGIVS